MFDIIFPYSQFSEKNSPLYLAGFYIKAWNKLAQNKINFTVITPKYKYDFVTPRAMCHEMICSDRTLTIKINNDYNSYGYGPSTNMPDMNLTGTSANYDWGVNNPISNGGNIANRWRTLTLPEWNYILNIRNTPSGIRFAKAQVNEVNGVILLPDDWTTDTYNLNNTNSIGAYYSSNVINASQWATIENVGGVFLPAAGGRFGTTVADVGSTGFYWLSSSNSSCCAY